jgi:hypothetical protein
MATVTTLAGGATAGRTAGSVPYLVSVEINFAAAATAKGSALAAADIIEALNVPANTVALTAGIEVISALVGESADTRLLLGVTGGDVDAFVASWDATAAAAGAYAPAAATVPVVFGTADTIDLEIDAATTAPTAGVLRVWAVLMDVDGRYGAEEADRDQLA